MSRDNSNKTKPTGHLTTYQAGVLQASAHRLLQRHSEAALKPFGITKMEWMTLGTIQDAGPQGIRLTLLSEQLGTTVPYIMTLIKSLEQKKQVVRAKDASDSRATVVRVSKSFTKQGPKIEKALRKSLREKIYSHVNQKDFQTYVKVLERLRDIK
jgi:DNA-binding MarR family transcriptional regulator